MSTHRLLILLVATAVLCVPSPATSLDVFAPELVTVGPREAVMTWTTDSPCQGSVRYGPSAGDLRWELSETAQAQFHRVELYGLQPDQAYVYEIDSCGLIAENDNLNPGYFYTLTEPRGEFLFRFGTINDMHIGEESSGILTLGDIVIGKGFSWPDPENPYWMFSNEAALEGLLAHDIELLVNKGDVASEALLEEYEIYLNMIDGYPVPVSVVRGSHDCAGLDEEDSFLDILGLASANQSFSYGGFKFLLIDTIEPILGLPELLEETRGFLEFELNKDPGVPVLLFTHYPPKGPFGMHGAGVPLLAILDSHPEILAVFAGHSHRAAVDLYLTADGRVVPLIETPSSKEYPLGYTIYDVYTDGFVQTFHRSDCEECRAWQYITRGEYWGAAPMIMMGDLGDRCFTYLFEEPISGGDDDDDDLLPDPSDSDDGFEFEHKENSGCGQAHITGIN